MTIELSKQQRADVSASIKRYFRENMPEPIGDLAADTMLNYILEEIGPVIYNDAQARMQQRVQDLDGELYAEPFQYWPNLDKKKKR